ncbi:hypothetical protein TNCV_1477181 [Trichonephila clavipes]|nr:hypothetical protein TNCV_1477181 [Trichonephila clavipes]
MQRQVILTWIVRSCGHVGHSTADTKGQRVAVHVETISVAPEEEIHGIEIWRAWKPDFRFTTSTLSPRISNIEVVLFPTKQCAGAVTPPPGP